MDAVGRFQAGRLDEAIALCRKILVAYPTNADALHLLGLALSRQGAHAEGAAAIEKSLALNGKQPPALCNLGEIYRLLARLSDAERVLREALRQQPRFVEAAFNLANVLKEQGRADDAIAAYQQAIAWKPDHTKAHFNLANTLRSEGRLKRALAQYQQVLRFQPDHLEAIKSIGGVHGELGEHEEAMPWHERAIAASPDDLESQAALGNSWYAMGEIEKAAVPFRRILAARPDDLLQRLRVESLCETIAPDEETIARQRARFLSTLEELAASPHTLDVGRLHTSGAEPLMPWTYQGCNERPFKERYASLFAQAITPLDHAPRPGKPRVGVVVTTGHEGVYFECLGRLVARLPQDEMRVTVVTSASGRNILRYLGPDLPVEYFVIPDRVDEAARRLRDEQFDLLHYWEIGTDSTNYFLPFFRPAPVQSSCWGWPTTSGQPHVDYFVSSRLIEPEDAETHYTEQLIRLETLPTWYRRPSVPQPLKPRSAYGLPEQGRIYVCSQNLRKYHPDFDAILADILRRDPAGRVYAIEDSQPRITRLLRERFDRRIPDVASRIVFVRRHEKPDYLNLVALADVMLDTPHYGGGANSLNDSVACGTPFVTLPGAYHRGRYGFGISQRLQLPEIVATSSSHYAELAVAIANDRDRRQTLRTLLKERGPVLFEDESAVHQHARFFLDAIARNRSSAGSA